MDNKEVRMRCIEAISNSGVREPGRLIKDAKELEEWVNAAEDKVPAPTRRSKKTGGQVETPA